MIELIVASLIVLLVSIWAAHAWAQRLRDLQAQALAVWMMTARDAAQSYLERHGPALVLAEGADALTHAGFADWAAPRWDEMRAAHLVPQGWVESGPLGSTVGLSVLRSGLCPQAPCKLLAIVHTREPLLTPDGQRVDEGLVAQWLMAARGEGMVVWQHKPEILSGAARSLPAPDGWSAGTVALLSEGGSLSISSEDSTVDMSRYLTVRDERDPDFQGEASAVGDIQSGASLRASNYLVLGQTSIEHDRCDEEGALSLERGHDGTLLCRQGRWRSAGRAGGGGFLFNTGRGCFDSRGFHRGNPVTGECSCPFNYAPIMVSDVGTEASAEGRTSGYVCMVTY